MDLTIRTKVDGEKYLKFKEIVKPYKDKYGDNVINERLALKLYLEDIDEKRLKKLLDTYLELPKRNILPFIHKGG